MLTNLVSGAKLDLSNQVGSEHHGKDEQLPQMWNEIRHQKNRAASVNEALGQNAKSRG